MSCFWLASGKPLYHRSSSQSRYAEQSPSVTCQVGSQQKMVMFTAPTGMVTTHVGWIVSDDKRWCDQLEPEDKKHNQHKHTVQPRKAIFIAYAHKILEILMHNVALNDSPLPFPAQINRRKNQWLIHCPHLYTIPGTYALHVCTRYGQYQSNPCKPQGELFV